MTAVSDTPVDFINIFVRPPGDLLYYLAVIGITQASFFMALGQRLRWRGERPAQRYTLAALGTVIVWAVLMIGALFALLAGQPADAILPPMERAAQVITLLLLGWAFVTADVDLWRGRANTLLLILIVGVVLGYVVTGLDWSGVASTASFNTTIYGTLWTLVMGGLSTAGVIICLTKLRHITDAPLKAVFFVLVLVGCVTTLAQTVQNAQIDGANAGNYAGALRLAFLAALVLLPALIYRAVIGHLETELAAYSQTNPVILPPSVPVVHMPQPASATNGLASERESAQLMRALGMILERSTPETIPQKIVSAAITALKADVGALLLTNDPHYADFSVGVDKVMERSITGISLNLDDQPTLMNAIERRVQRPLYLDRNSDELRDLYTRIDTDQRGPTYFQPLVNDNELLCVLMIGMPYSKRELGVGEQELLKGIGIIAARLMALSRSARETGDHRAIASTSEEMTPIFSVPQQELAEARYQIEALSQSVTALKAELETERERVAAKLSDSQEGQSVSQRILVLSDEQERLRGERDQLAVRLRQAETAVAGMGAGQPDGDRAIYATLFEALNREREELLHQKDRLQAQIAEMRASQRAPVPHTVQDLLNRMSQEKARLEVERDQLGGRLSDLETQLKAFGVQGNAVEITRALGGLFEQRAALQAKLDAMKGERESLLAERATFEEVIQREAEREARLEKLQGAIKNLASDREAALKQRDQLRGDRTELLARQEELRAQVNRLLAEAMGFEQELTDSQAETTELRSQLRGLADQSSAYATERDRLTAALRAADLDRDVLLAQQDGDSERLHQIGSDGVNALTGMIEQLSGQRGDLERELYEARTALASAHDTLQRLQVRPNAAQRHVDPAHADQPNGSAPLKSPEVVLGMLQELRTPMTSVVGYVELVLNESAGILGEMQRKFLQRVSANVTRLTRMIDDLIRITALDAGGFDPARQAVDVIALIEDAITAAAVQLREKGLIVHLNLQEDLPAARVDRDATQQVIGQLLTNAYLATPPGGAITVSARRWSGSLGNGKLPSANGSRNGSHSPPTDGLLITVEDRGGGIAPEDQARVFARKYKAENPLVQGLGDTGVGLAIAKALVEAHGGTISVEVTPGIGSAFNVVLPFEAPAALISVEQN